MKKTWLRIPALFLCLVMLSGIALAQEPQGVIDLEKIKSEYKYGDVLTFDTYGQLTEENRDRIPARLADCWQDAAHTFCVS